MIGAATIAGHPVVAARVHVPSSGPWFADVELEGDPDVEGQVTLQLGELALVGTVDATRSGTFGLQRKLRLVAGAGSWGKLLGAKAYHNDAGVRALTVAEDAAREAGESLGDATPASTTIGKDYVRPSGVAARALEDALGGANWWVDYDGVTQAGTRIPVAAVAGTYEVLEHDPRARLVVIAVDDLEAVGIGSVLTDRLDAPQTVRELELEVTSASARIRAWCGEGVGGRLASAIRNVIARATEGRLFGLWRYRVVTLSGDRVNLQPINLAAGLPDLANISMVPGVAGAHAELALGAEVLVEFIEGKRTAPVITHFAGKDGNGFVPVRLTLGSAAAAPNAARQGDAVRVTIPIGTFLVAASDGVANAAPVLVDGTITSGSSKVGIGP